jgi:hypothetical protein
MDQQTATILVPSKSRITDSLLGVLRSVELSSGFCQCSHIDHPIHKKKPTKKKRISEKEHKKKRKQFCMDM